MSRRHKKPSQSALPWTKADVSVLRRYAGKKPSSQIAVILGRTAKAVEQKALKSGIALGTVEPWTPADVQRLHRQAGRVSTAELARLFKRTPRAIQHKASKLGLSLRRH